MDNNKTNKPTGSGAASAPASDNFFVKPPAINLPKGGGAIRGVDEKFQVIPSNGSAAQSIPLFIGLPWRVLPTLTTVRQLVRTASFLNLSLETVGLL